MCNKRAFNYLEALLQIKRSMINCNDQEKDKVWVEFYKEVTKDGYKIERLPELLALIHPEFYFKNGISIKNNIPWEKNLNFVKGILKTDRCQAGIYSGYECVFNNYPDLRGKCQADHIWPNSLGGPSILDNRMILCKYHNEMKSNDIYIYNWHTIPTWLPKYLDLIYRLKL